MPSLRRRDDRADAPNASWSDLRPTACELMPKARPSRATDAARAPDLHVLCRSLPQLRRTCWPRGVRSVYVDFQDIREYREAVAMAHARWRRDSLATPRIQKPDEMGIFHALAKHGADGILVRNLAGLRFFRERQIPFVADFSLNCDQRADGRSTCCEQGARRDHGLVRSEPRATARPGRRRAAGLAGSGRPSAHADVPHGALRVLRGAFAGHEQDQLRPALRHARGEAPRSHRHGASAHGRRRLPQHAVQRRAAKRAPKSCRSCSPRGVRHFRIELLDDRRPSPRRTIWTSTATCSPAASAATKSGRRLKAANRVGVTRGTLEERRNPLAII